jgi:hypothetical protein
MSFAALMEQLKLEYIQSLPEKIDTIQFHIKQQYASHLREDFHKLKGTGLTYGLPEISTLAQTVEAICLAQPEQSVQAATEALPILRDIYQSRARDSTHPLESDPRFHSISDQLQKAA